MPIEIGIWRVDTTPQQVQPILLNAESRLEEWLVNDLSLIAPDLLVIGQQVKTPYGGFIDILALNANGDLTIIELKRDKTPRDVVAQTLDYASWVKTLKSEDIGKIFQEFQQKKQVTVLRSLDEAFKDTFSTTTMPEDINSSHNLLIVATELDESSERIVAYLSEEYAVPINVIFFRFFRDGDREYFTRAWFLDPANPELPENSGSRGQWNGEYYASFGRRDWAYARKYGYIAAGGGSWYSRTLGLLEPGARVWVNVPEHGYTGVGIVTEPKVEASKFMIETDQGQLPITQLPDCDPALLRDDDDPITAEYLVRINWLHTVPLEQAVKERGFFGNQNSACQPRAPKWEFTINRLKNRWDIS